MTTAASAEAEAAGTPEGRHDPSLERRWSAGAEAILDELSVERSRADPGPIGQVLIAGLSLAPLIAGRAVAALGAVFRTKEDSSIA